jgi:hypothetical protein
MNPQRVDIATPDLAPTGTSVDGIHRGSGLAS